MQRKFFTLVILLCAGALQFATAQTLAVRPDANFKTQTIEASVLNPATSANNDDWTLYADEENKLYYIDFENLKVNLSDIVVRNEKGEVMLKDNVFDLPVNTIYELDFSKFKPGNYEVELRTFTDTIRKEVTIK